jgi:sigma-B regulation protein RsbU (phosphoserine phosphatase)
MYKDHPEGVIRVYMSEEHEFDWFEVSMLKAIASEAAAAIVNARLHAENIRAVNIQRQLRLAGEVQRRMIPGRTPKPDGFDIAAIYVPCFELAGDFYDFIHLPEENLGVVNIYEMSEVLGMVNRDLCADTLSSDFATMFYGVINLEERRFTYSSAGHVPPMLIRNGEVRHLSIGGGVLGIDAGLTWEQEVFALESGDTILIYTDGLIEAMNFEDEPFGRRRTEEALMSAVELTGGAEGIAKHVLWEMRRFAGLQKRPDDLTLLTIRVL